MLNFYRPPTERRKLFSLMSLCPPRVWGEHWVSCTRPQSAPCTRSSRHVETCSIITAHKRCLRRLCFHRCRSVHRGSTWAGTPRQVHPVGRYPLRQVCPLPPSRYTPWAGTPPSSSPPSEADPPRAVAF